MEHLIQLAQQLGQQIAQHQRTTLLAQAQKQVNEDTQAVELIREYQQQAQKIHQLEQERKPIEVEDKSKLQNIEQQISANEKLKELTKRQVDFVEMMQKVKKSIDAQLPSL